MILMTDREELEEVAQIAADRTIAGHGDKIRQHVDEGVTQALTRCGLDVKNPLEQQTDMQFLRATRKAAGSVRSKALLGVVGIAVTGTLAWFLSKLA